MSVDVQKIKEQVLRYSDQIERVRAEVRKVLVGQDVMLSRLLIALLTGGHVLLEGLPGLAKTTAIKALASAIRCRFNRIQFTPDLLPADLIGTMIYNPREGSFGTRKGPIFANLVLADEINRAPSKVQSALLEAMQEHQVTIGDETYPLEEPFLVLATQNPIEQEGTYPLPEAQVIRARRKNGEWWIPCWMTSVAKFSPYWNPRSWQKSNRQCPPFTWMTRLKITSWTLSQRLAGRTSTVCEI